MKNNMNMNVYFIPTFSDGNDYLKNITNGLEISGVNILSNTCINKRKAPFESLFNAFRHKNYVVHFNWIENKVSTQNIGAYVNFVFIRSWIILLKILGAKIVWTMHNRKPHLTDRENLIESFYAFFLSKCDLVVVHCRESQNILKDELGYSGKILYIPHGNYCGYNKRKIEYNKMQSLKFLYFGAVSRYKNIPILIKAFKLVREKYPDVRLNICGKCKDDNLDLEIRKEIENFHEIDYENRFLSEKELNDKLEQCCAVVLPYDKESMLNSGSAIMAFSNGRSVIIPEFGYIKDIKNEDFVFSYDYGTEDEHVNRLACKWIGVIETAKKDEEYWRRMGEKAYSYANRELDWSTICDKLASYYEELFN